MSLVVLLISKFHMFALPSPPSGSQRQTTPLIVNGLRPPVYYKVSIHEICSLATFYLDLLTNWRGLWKKDLSDVWLQWNLMFFSVQLCKLPPQCWYFAWQLALSNLQLARTSCLRSRQLQICSRRFLVRFLLKLHIFLGIAQKWFLMVRKVMKNAIWKN